jgi:hypothetical protein
LAVLRRLGDDAQGLAADTARPPGVPAPDDQPGWRIGDRTADGPGLAR